MGYFEDAGQVIACEQQTYFQSSLPGRFLKLLTG